MIRVLEGANCVGKSTLANHLISVFGIPVFDDPGRHGALDWVGPMSARDLQIQSLQHDLTVAALSQYLNLIVDRWVMSNVAYGGLRGCPVSPRFVKRVIDLAGDVKVFLLEAPEDVLRERWRLRGRLAPHDVSAQVNAFREAAIVYQSMGGMVHVINTNRNESEVLNEVRHHW